MKISRELILTGGALLLIVLVNAVARSQAPSLATAEVSRDIVHLEQAERAVRTLERGANPLSTWLDDRSSKFATLASYQPLAYEAVVALHFVLPRRIALKPLFLWVRFIAVVLLPLSYFFACLMIGFDRSTAVTAAVIGALVPPGYLAEDVFPQVIAGHLLLLTAGLAFRAVRSGAMLGLTMLAHLLYGYVGALGLLALAWMKDEEVPRHVRIPRAAQVALLALPVAALHLAPLLIDSWAITGNRWQQAGALSGIKTGHTFRSVFNGDLLDAGQFPLITLLTITSGALYLVNLLRGKSSAAANYVALASLAWIMVFFGRAFWAPLLVLLGLLPDGHLHLVFGEAHVFVVLLAAQGLQGIREELPWRRRTWSDEILLEPARPPGRPRPRASSRPESW